MNQKSLFVVILRYLVDLAIIDTWRPEHLLFLEENYNKKNFIVSGRQKPCTGGLILSSVSSRDELQSILSNDPYYIHKCAEYDIYEFVPSMYDPYFAKFFLDIHND